MEKVKMPRSIQEDIVAFYYSDLLANNTLHLYAGNPTLGSTTTLDDMSAVEINAESSVSWYTPASLTYDADAIFDPNVNNQLLIVAQSVQFRYDDGDGDDAELQIDGFYISNGSTNLVAFHQFDEPYTMAAHLDGFSVQPAVPVPSLA